MMCEFLVKVMLFKRLKHLHRAVLLHFRQMLALHISYFNHIHLRDGLKVFLGRRGSRSLLQLQFLLLMLFEYCNLVLIVLNHIVDTLVPFLLIFQEVLVIGPHT